MPFAAIDRNLHEKTGHGSDRSSTRSNSRSDAAISYAAKQINRVHTKLFGQPSGQSLVEMKQTSVFRVTSEGKQVARSCYEGDDAVGHELHAWIRAVALDPAVVQLLHDDAGLPQRERLVPLDVGE